MNAQMDEALENFAYALKCVTEVAARRRNTLVLALYENLRGDMETFDLGNPDAVSRLPHFPLLSQRG